MGPSRRSYAEGQVTLPIRSGVKALVMSAFSFGIRFRVGLLPVNWTLISRVAANNIRRDLNFGQSYLLVVNRVIGRSAFALNSTLM